MGLVKITRQQKAALRANGGRLRDEILRRGWQADDLDS